MGAAQFLKARVMPDTKRRVQLAAERQLLTESVWLRRLVTSALRANCDESGNDVTMDLGRVVTGLRRCSNHTTGSVSRLYIRLRNEDARLLRERATARGMAGAATYVSVLVRAHLRNLTPLPKEELVALRRAVAALGAIGRNLNQIARAASAGGRAAGPPIEDLRSILKLCEGLRDHVKSTIKVNVNSWETGVAEAKI